ncbi:hypothetical protein FRC18_007001 [Serendipita sp. 400]|nr:hypothetical protein FRC18_007001 [Serendipita sp. 400]
MSLVICDPIPAIVHTSASTVATNLHEVICYHDTSINAIQTKRKRVQRMGTGGGKVANCRIHRRRRQRRRTITLSLIPTA